MKMKHLAFIWGLVLLTGWNGLVQGAQQAVPPYSEDFQSGTLPKDHLRILPPPLYGLWIYEPWDYTTIGAGRISLVADTTQLTTNSIPVGLHIITDQHTTSGSARFRGNFYQCDETVILNRQSMPLGRPAATPVTFMVFESTTSNGTYNAISTNIVTAGIGTNTVMSGEMNVPLIAGRYYLMAAGWNNTASYTYLTSLSGSYHPDTVGFGSSFSGFGSSGYPVSSTSVSNSFSSTLYYQGLVYSTNGVVRMDAATGGSYSTNSVDLSVNLSGYSEVWLSYRYRDNNDENGAADGIFLSDDNGTTFTRIEAQTDSAVTWKSKTLDLTTLAAEAEMAIADVTTIRFQQSDNSTWTGGDGREFDDVILYSKPDMLASSITASSSFLWKGFTAIKTLPITLNFYSKGSGSDFSQAGVNIEYGIIDKTTDTLMAYGTKSIDWEIGTAETRYDSEAKNLYMSPTMKFPNLFYSLYAYTDEQDAVDEAIEDNNSASRIVMINHYSGNLWFDDIETKITVTSWGTNVAESATHHWITGTGTLNGKSFSFTGLDVIKDPTTLDYQVAPTETAVISVAFPERFEINHVSYWVNGSVALSKNGASAKIKVLYPSGLGVSTTSQTILDSTHVFGSSKLTQQLYPAGPVAESGTFYVVEETKPVGYEASTMVWNPATGIFSFGRSGIWSVRNGYYRALASHEADLVSAKMAAKKSNSAYLSAVSSLQTNPQVYTGENGDARLSAVIGLDQTQMTAHFPYGVTQEWGAGSTIVIDKDLINAAGSQLKNPAGTVFVEYARDCHGSIECAGNVGMTAIECTPTDHTTIGPDGGFMTPMEIRSGGELQWGTRWNDEFAQKTDAFRDGDLYIAGHFIRGDLSNFDPNDFCGPSEILLSGMPTNSVAAMERPSQANYADGYAEYAGLNLRTGARDMAAESIIGGQKTGSWQLTDRSKYYVRQSGVSGIHEAEPGTFPSEMTIYDYPFKFSNYGLSYLSGQPEESRINGSVDVREPCGITMAFENMMLDCIGELEEAELAGSDTKTLIYWDAVIQPLTLFFAPTASSTCGDQARRLCMGLTTQCANVNQTLAGILGFMPDGELGTPADQIEGVPSRLSVPNQIEFDGPGSETYYFNPVAMPYYNDYSASGDDMSDRGWINFAGTVDVSFFEDLQVHVQTSASTNSTVANIYMMGGWSDGGDTFFNSDPDGFDTGNAGFPTAIPHKDYQNTVSDTYRVHAKRTWIGVIDFDYPLDWSSSTKSFKSPEELEEPLLVATVQHKTDYLSAENTEISFGLQYDGVPQINLANMAFNAVDEATGMASAFTDAVGDEIHAAIESGVGALDDTLSDLPEMLFDPVFDTVLDPLIDDFYTDLYNAYSSAPDATDFGTVVTQYIYGVGGPAYQNVDHILKNLADASGGSVALLNEIDGNLDQAIELIDAFASVVTATNGVTLPGNVSIPGLLSQNGGEYETLTDLGVGILSVLAETLYDSISGTIQEELNTALESATPSLSAITQTLLDLREVLVDIQAKLDDAGSIAEELNDTLNSPLIQDPINTMNNEIMVWFDALPDAGSAFDEYTPEEVKAMLRQKMTDAFYGSVPCANVQQVLRSQLYEVESSIHQAVDSAFQQLNLAMRNMVSQYLAGIDDQINSALGDLSDVMGSGQIEGYAHIRNDTLNELRLDGKFQWKVPDEMEFNAFLLIRDLNSTTPGGCGVHADSLPEVTLGTTDFGLGLLGSDIRADIAVKFAFAENGGSLDLLGLGGSFEMTEGEIGFESFVVNEFYAAVAFGKLENYLSANIRCEFTSYAVEGGIFLGKACNIDPFSWDPDVQEVLGDPPFAGIYVYGEGWMPIVDWGCLFRIKAGVGAGIFAFVDGPVGGKVFVGASGEALCVVSVSGDVTLVGLKDGDDLRMKGKGRISGRAGCCPFCVKFKKTVTITYDNGDWDADY
ncbi:MAG: hypothetical protein JXR25_06140 [Pontiellaceae bacterium]|nr:hypothetical protein [Pontiellaceae bacterium]MBN2784388.1 hypothetical protein [Pontiellaceae bacterium]